MAVTVIMLVFVSDDVFHTSAMKTLGRFYS